MTELLFVIGIMIITGTGCLWALMARSLVLFYSILFAAFLTLLGATIGFGYGITYVGATIGGIVGLAVTIFLLSLSRRLRRSQPAAAIPSDQ